MGCHLTKEQAFDQAFNKLIKKLEVTLSEIYAHRLVKDFLATWDIGRDRVDQEFQDLKYPIPFLALQAGFST